MKVGVDHYSYHRFFGEVYPEQQAPDRSLTMEEYLRIAKKIGCDGVTLESCFLPRLDADYLASLKALMDGYGFDRVYGWGHPDGREGGANPTAFDEMIASIERAKAVGAPVMKVCGASLKFRFQPHGPMIEKLSRQLGEAAAVAARYGIKLAVENHIDFTPDEMLAIIRNVNSPNLGMNFDSGNFLRLLSDPVEGMKKLAPHVLSTHIKDLKPLKGANVEAWYFFACTPVGDGLVDNRALADILRKHNYTGFLATEIDFLHPDYGNDEFRAVQRSVRELKRISA
jgi:sugar phosphate isomerase/epimerase